MVWAQNVDFVTRFRCQLKKMVATIKRLPPVNNLMLTDKFLRLLGWITSDIIFDIQYHFKIQLLKHTET